MLRVTRNPTLAPQLLKTFDTESITIQDCSRRGIESTEQNFSDISDFSFEQASTELEKIVRTLEDGKVSLEDSVKIYERGITLKNHCDKKLNEAEAKVEKILIQKDGSAIIEPFDDVKQD